MIPNFSQVDSFLYRGGAPSADDLKTLKDIFGVKKIISLDGKIGDEIHPFCEDLDLEHEILPMFRGNDPNILLLEKQVIPNIRSEGPVFLHCKHGKDRTGMAVAMYKIFHGENLQSALKEAQSFGMGSGLPENIGMTYYSGVISFARKRNNSKPASDKNDADIVQNVQQSDHYALPHNQPLQPADSFQFFEDPSSFTMNSVRVTASNQRKIYCRCNPSDLLKFKQLWFDQKQKAKGNLPLYSAEIVPNANIEKVNKIINTPTINYYITKPYVDGVEFKDGSFFIFYPNCINNIEEEREEREDQKDQNDAFDVGNLGVRDNYSQTSTIPYESGGYVGDGFSGFVMQPFGGGLY
jgi:hypothetical protein